jgi:hypothetical protein
MTTPAPSEALGPEPDRDETRTGDLYGKQRWYVCAEYADWHRARADALAAELRESHLQEIATTGQLQEALAECAALKLTTDNAALPGEIKKAIDAYGTQENAAGVASTFPADDHTAVEVASLEKARANLVRLIAELVRERDSLRTKLSACQAVVECAGELISYETNGSKENPPWMYWEEYFQNLKNALEAVDRAATSPPVAVESKP